MTLDPRQRRDVHFEARAQSLKARGIEVRSEEVKRQVAADLQLVDRVKAENPSMFGRRPRKKAKPKLTTADVARPDLHAEALARKSGGEFYARAVDPNDNETVGRKLKGLEAEKTMALVRRLNILKRRGPGRIRGNQTMDQGPYEYPRLATKIACLGMSYEMKLGDFRGKTKAEANKILRRFLEDICDESNAVVGVPWWVK